MARVANAFSVKDRILHGVYGLGTVSAIDPLHTVIEFDLAGRKKFVSSLVRLEHSDVAAPEPPAKKTRARKTAPKPKS